MGPEKKPYEVFVIDSLGSTIFKGDIEDFTVHVVKDVLSLYNTQKVKVTPDEFFDSVTTE